MFYFEVVQRHRLIIHSWNTAKKNEYGGAAETYEIALRNAKEIQDNQAIKAITKALKDANILKEPPLREPPLRKKSAASFTASTHGVRAR